MKQISCQGRNPNAPAILRLPGVKAITGLSRSSIYGLMKSPVQPFPKPIRLSARCVGWLESEVTTYLEECVAASRNSSKGGL